MEEYTIIGGGISGLTLAYKLLYKGYSVRLIEAVYPGHAATGHSAGIIVLQLPEDLIDFALESIRFYTKISEGGGYIVNKGAILISRSKGCMNELQRIFQDRGLTFRYIDWVEAEELTGVKLNIADDEYIAFIDEYLVDVGEIVSRLYRLIENLGGTITIDKRATLPRRGTVIVAAGPWTPRIIPEIRKSVIVYRCQATVYEAPKPSVIIEDDVNDFYAVTHPGGELIAGNGENKVLSDPAEGFTPDPWEQYLILERYSRRVKDAEHGYPVKTWSAPCIVGKDSKPLVGKVRENIYVVTGLNGAGITLAGGLAKILIDNIESGTRIPPSLRPDRPMPEADKPPEPYDTC
ncbi:MAG: FAD-binding oxidoreductase [Desulfurococcales archaeon]|nr:FAD-binding oxidoreductase [Desulfurococcales archaeon]